MAESVNEDGTIKDLPLPARGDLLLPCGHAPEVEDDRIILDQCFECGWATEHRKLSNKVNEAAAERGEAETELIRWCREHGETGFDQPLMAQLFERAIRVNLRFGREEALREKLKELVEEEASTSRAL